MTSLAIALLSILVFFAGFLLLRTYTSWSVCALCAAVSGTWIVLLILLYMDFTIDPLVVGILMGGSGVGAMYLLEDKLNERYYIFCIAFLATMIAGAYLLITELFAVDAVVILLLLWIGSLGLFLRQDSGKLKGVVAKIIKCCKNW